jgi:hypothetical protein
MSIINKIREKLGLDPDVFLALNDKEIQEHLAMPLRNAAIKALRESRKFRADYAATNDPTRPRSVDEFLNTRAANTVWAGEEEAGALGRLLDYTVELTDIDIRRGRTEPAIHYPNRSRSEHAKTIHLQIDNNAGHFSLLGQEAEPDGNCLYNAFAQFIQQAVKLEHQVIESQKSALSKYSKFRPNTAAETQAEEARLAALPEAKRAEIQRNYDAAVELASKEEKEDKGSSLQP